MNVGQMDNLTERERALLICVLGIREFGYALRASMTGDGVVFAGFSEDLVPKILLIPGDEIWDLITDLTECVLDGTGDLELLTPDAAEARRMVRSHIRDLDENDRLTKGLSPDDLQAGPSGKQ